MERRERKINKIGNGERGEGVKERNEGMLIGSKKLYRINY